MKKELIKKWCELALTKTKAINYKAPSSYGLKHYCESSIGDYISNDEIKEVMIELGFNSDLKLNSSYNISKIINRVLLISGKKMYSNDNRVFHSSSKTIVCQN